MMSDGELNARFDNLERILGLHNDAVLEKLGEQKQDIDKLEGRTRALERVRNLAGGGFAVILAVWGAFKADLFNIS